MRKLHLLLGLSTLGLFAFVGCGDNSEGGSPGPGSGGASSGSGGKGGSSAGGSSSGGSTAGKGGGGKGGSASGGTNGQAGEGTGGSTDGCGTGAACAATETCVDGECKLNDGQTCTENSECVNTCIAAECGPRSDLTEPCDFEGAGGAGGQGGAPGAAGTPGTAGAGGEPPEMGNGDDADCLDGLGCDSGECKRKIGTDCTDAGQCLSGVCHKNKCTPTDKGTCVGNACGMPSMDGLCAPSGVAENNCSFNHIPDSNCFYSQKGVECIAGCQCILLP